MIRPTQEQWDRAEAAARMAALRFAKTYAALDWKWSSGGIKYLISAVPDARAILASLTAMLDDLHKKVDAATEVPDEGVLTSYQTGGLHVKAEWDEDRVTIVFAFTDTVNCYGTVTEGVESEGGAP